METPNVNNLNGVPNFGEGFPEDKITEIPTVETVEDAGIQEEEKSNE